MRLGFHYHIPALSDQTGSIRTMGLLGIFIDALAEHFDRLVSFQYSPTPKEMGLMDYPLKAHNVDLVDLGLHLSVPNRILRFPKTKNLLFPYRQAVDAMLIRGPTPLLPGIANIFDGLPLVLLIVGDYTTNIDNLPQPWWRKELIRLWSRVNKYQQLKIMKKGLVFVNNHLLYEEFQPIAPNLIETKTTTLRKTDFFHRPDTCQTPPYHILYAGRLDRAKGLPDIVEALSILKNIGIPVILDLVGWASANDPIVEELTSLAQKLGIGDCVKFHGYKSLGPELFAYYEKADIYIIASRGSEGFPRTIWEAMAHSTPVIATNVGSIANAVKDAAVIVPPSNPGELAHAMKKIITNPSLRQELIANGRRLALQNTLEIHTGKMAEEIKNHLKKIK
jgi:glycosyltransferase involved in cell wall biosynthesis